MERFFFQAFIKTAATIYKKIQDGVFDVSNEVGEFSFLHGHPHISSEFFQ